MKSEQMGAYLSLCELLRTIMQEPGVEKVSSLIMANFELKQIFKVPAAMVTADATAVIDTGDSSSITVEEPSIDERAEAAIVMAETGIRPQAIDSKEAKSRLQRMRDDALRGALDDRYGVELGDEKNMVIAQDPKANEEILDRIQRQKEASQIIANGGAGKNSFGRSS